MKKRNYGLLFSYTNTFLNMLCGLFLSSFLLRQLGDAEYGLYQTMSSFANYLVLLEFGTGTVMSRNIAACRAKGNSQIEIEKNISTIWAITGFLSLLIVFVSTIFYLSIDKLYANSLTSEQIIAGKKIFALITFYLVASFYSQTLSGVTLAFEDYSFSPLSSIIRTVVRTCLLVALLLNWKNSIIIAVVDVILSFSIAAFSYLYCRRKYRVKITLHNFDKAILKTSLPFCLAIFLQGFVNQANNNVGKFILGVKVGPEAVSLLSVGLYIYSVFSSLTTVPISMYMPQITRDVLSGFRGRTLTEHLVQPSRLIALVGGTVLFGFFAAGRAFIRLVYGEQYNLAWMIALILMVPMFINMTSGVVINVLDVMNKRLVRSLILCGMAVLNILLSIYLIDAWGSIGSAVATSICVVVGQVVILNIYYSKVIGINILWLYRYSYKGILVFQLLAAVTGYAVSEAISNVFWSFFAGGATYVIIAFGGYLLFGTNKTEKNALRGIAKRLKSPPLKNKKGLTP